MTVLDDIVGIVVFFTVNSLVARQVSGGEVPLYMIPVMIFLPVVIGAVVGYPTGLLLKKFNKKTATLAILLLGITATMLIGWRINSFLLSGITLNYMLMGFCLYTGSCFRKIFWGNVWSQSHPYAGYGEKIPWIDTASPLRGIPCLYRYYLFYTVIRAAKKGFELAGEIKR